MLQTFPAKEICDENAELHNVGIDRGEHFPKAGTVREGVNILLHSWETVAEVG